MLKIPAGLKSVLAKTLVIFFFAELLVTFLLELAPPGLWRGFADSLLVILISVSVLYWWVLRKEALNAARAEQAARQINEIINRIWSVSLRSSSKEELLRRILGIVLENRLMSLKKKGAIFLTEKGKLILKAQIGFPEVQRGLCATVEPGRCLCGKVLETGKMVFKSAVDADHQVIYEGMEPHGHYCVPIRNEERTLGVLTLYTEVSQRSDPGYERFLESVAAIIGRIVEYKDLEHSLAQMQRMDSLGKMAGAVAHDFNNILTAIVGFSAIALDEEKKDTAAYLYFTKISEAAAKGSALTRQLLAFARKEPADQELLDLNAVLRSVSEVVGGLLPGNIKLKLELSPGELGIIANRSQMEQVAMNLAVNARDAMPAGGELRIRSERLVCGEEKGCISGLRGCEHAAALYFEDTGVGMSEETIQRIFEPFFTTKPPDKGTGLGLSTVHGIVKQHSGAINVSSVQGKGSVFQICLPLALEK